MTARTPRWWRGVAALLVAAAALLGLTPTAVTQEDGGEGSPPVLLHQRTFVATGDAFELGIDPASVPADGSVEVVIRGRVLSRSELELTTTGAGLRSAVYQVARAAAELPRGTFSYPVKRRRISPVVIVLVIVAAWWVLTRKAPSPDHPFRLTVDDPFGDEELRRRAATLGTARLFDLALLEKVALTALVTVIFSQILPDVQSTPLQLAVGVGTLVVANTAVSEFLVRRGTGWETAARQFIAVGLINVGLVIAADVLLPIRNGDVRLGNTLFFVLLITLIVTLFDRYRPIYVAREEQRWEALAARAQALRG